MVISEPAATTLPILPVLALRQFHHIRLSKVMSVSAVDRAPVEIWSQILALTIRSPLIPHPDATFAQSMDLLSDRCASERFTRELAQITGRLRQVCRSWDTLIQLLYPMVVYCNFDFIYSRGDASSPVVPYSSESRSSKVFRHSSIEKLSIQTARWMI